MNAIGHLINNITFTIVISTALFTMCGMQIDTICVLHQYSGKCEVDSADESKHHNIGDNHQLCEIGGMWLSQHPCLPRSFDLAIQFSVSPEWQGSLVWKPHGKHFRHYMRFSMPLAWQCSL